MLSFVLVFECIMSAYYFLNYFDCDDSASYRALYIKNVDVTHSLKVFIALYTPRADLGGCLGC